MERRNEKRIAVGYPAEIFHNGKSYECVIENLSAGGVNIVTVSLESKTDFRPREILELKFEPHPGETVRLSCRIQWSRQTPPHRLSKRLGLEIIDPSWDKCAFFV
jgi:hypothetical protein